MRTVPGTVALPRWQRVAIYVGVGLLVASGLAWVAVAWPPGEHVEPWQRGLAVWLLRLHGVAAYAALVVVGGVLPVHLRLAWVRRRNRGSGALLVALWLWLAGSGLWLYYGPEGARDAVSLAHWAIGALLPAGLWLHRRWGRRDRATAPSRAGPGPSA